MLALLVTSGCGRKDDLDAGDPLAISVPSLLDVAPELSRVPIGSLGIAVSPAPGERSAPFLLRLASEPGAEVWYSFAKLPESITPESTSLALRYETPILASPPIDIEVFARKDGKVGSVRRLTWGYAADSTPPDLGAFRRFPLQAFTTATPVDVSTIERFAAGAATDIVTVTLDGRPSEWRRTGRTFARDGQLDIPEVFGSIDLAYVEVQETADALEILMATRTGPRPEVGVSYGLDIGPSGVSFDSFGSGADFVHRAVIENGRLELREKGKEQPSAKSPGTRIFFGEVIEWRISKADLPLLTDKDNVIVRPWTSSVESGVRIVDRMRPIYLRSTLGLERSTSLTRAGAGVDLEFMSDASRLSGEFARGHHDFTQGLVSDMEAFTGIPFFDTGAMPLVHARVDVNGYAGVNASDRGMLTTIGPLSGEIEQFQLVAHEIAHYPNALYSKITARWLQEGMSEWAAERLLWRRYPPRAVHRYINAMRVAPWFSAVGSGNIDSFHLDEWTDAPSDIGYSKSLMFMNLLDARVGVDVMRKAFQVGINTPMNGVDFRNFLERESGKNLADLFEYWALPGQPASTSDPRQLYADSDGDGLSNLDEEILGTNPQNSDSDGDGISDDEEAFRGLAPTSSAVGEPAAGSVVESSAAPNDNRELLRLVAAPDSVIQWSSDPLDPAPALAWSTPALLHPPFQIAARATTGSVTGNSVTISRPLRVAGNLVQTTAPVERILPVTPLRASALAPVTTATTLGTGTESFMWEDTPGDVPEHFARLDITGFATQETETDIRIRIRTLARPDPHGNDGSFFVAFDRVGWTDTLGPDIERMDGISVSNGSFILHEYNSFGGEVTSRPQTGIALTWGEHLEITVAKNILSAWLGGSVDKSICVWSDISVRSGLSIRDRAGCVAVQHPLFTRLLSRTPSAYGTGNLTVDVLTPTAGYDAAFATRAATVGVTALREFERALARPLPDRPAWPIHIYRMNSNFTGGLGSATVGGFLRLNTTIFSDPTRQDYLIAEQLARSHLAGLVERQNEARPFWIQEIYIQWLTASAMYAIRPSREVHAHHRARVDDYMCFTAGSCPGRFLGDVYLRDWNNSTLQSTGSVKSTMFALVLDATLGAETMSKAFTTFASRIPTAVEFQSMLRRLAPAQTTTIDTLFQQFVSGSGNVTADVNAIRALMSDGDNDGLLQFEETKLGAAGNGWLDP